MLRMGSKAPDFHLPDMNGNIHSLSEFIGKKVVLYFYPKDNTSGCTTQALAFKELYEEFKNENTVIIGISKDSPKSHQKFIEKYELPFLLLSDEKTDILSLYEVWQEKSMYGKKYMGVVRTTYILNEFGTIISAKEKVTPATDASCSIEYIKSRGN